MREVMFEPLVHQPSDVDYDILAGVPSANKNYVGSLDGAFNSKSVEERNKEFETYQQVRGGNNNRDIPGTTAKMAQIDPNQIPNAGKLGQN